MRSTWLALILRGCESIDFCVFRHESNQGLRTTKNVESRKDSHTLRSRARFARRLEGWQRTVCPMVRDARRTAQGAAGPAPHHEGVRVCARREERGFSHAPATG